MKLPFKLKSLQEGQGRGDNALPFIDPRALMSIKNLELRARIVVEGFWHGMHRSPYHGFSVEFTEYRQYVPGDDPRYLDWKLYARSDRYYIKKFEDETNLRCHLLVDQSQSMNYGTLGFTKAAYAQTFAATLGYFLFLQGDGIGLLSFDSKIREYLPARNRPGHLRRLMLSLEQPATGEGGTDLVKPVKRIMELVRKRGMIVLISDLLTPMDLVEKDLANLSAYGHEVILFQLLDPSEIRFEFKEEIQFEDVESGKRLFIDPVAARKSYQEKFKAHTETIQSLCRRYGIAFHQISVDAPLELTLFEFLRTRMRKAKR